MKEKRQRLLKTIDYHATGIRLALFRKVEDYLIANFVTRQDFADRLGVSKGYVSQVLNGTPNLSIRKLVQFGLAVGLVPVIQWVPVDEYLASDGNKSTSTSEIEKSPGET